GCLQRRLRLAATRQRSAEFPRPAGASRLHEMASGPLLTCEPLAKEGVPVSAPTKSPAASLRLEVQDSTAILTFDQPGSRANTLGQAVLNEFEAILAQLKKRGDVGGL